MEFTPEVGVVAAVVVVVVLLPPLCAGQGFWAAGVERGGCGGGGGVGGDGADVADRSGSVSGLALWRLERAGFHERTWRQDTAS